MEVKVEGIKDIPSLKDGKQEPADKPLEPPAGYEEYFRPPSLQPSSRPEVKMARFEDDLPPAPETDTAKAMGGVGLTLSVQEGRRQDTAPGEMLPEDRHRHSGKPRRSRGETPRADTPAPKYIPPKEEAAFSGPGDGAGGPPDDELPDEGNEGDPERARQWQFYKEKIHEPFVNSYYAVGAGGIDDDNRGEAVETLRQVDGMIRSGRREDTTVTASDLPAVPLQEKVAGEQDTEFTGATRIPEEDEIREMIEAAKREAASEAELSPTDAPVLPLGGMYTDGASDEKEFPAPEEGMPLPVLVSLSFYQELNMPSGRGETTVELYSYEEQMNMRRGSCMYSFITEPRGAEGEAVVTDITVRRQLRGGDGIVYIPDRHELAKLREVLAACQYVHEH